MIESTQQRLQYLRMRIEAESISLGEIAELQSLASHVDPGDTVLLEWAGVPEHTPRPALGLADEDVDQGDFSRMSWREALDALQAQYRVIQHFVACEDPIVVLDADLSNVGAPKVHVAAIELFDGLDKPYWAVDVDSEAVFQ